MCHFGSDGASSQTMFCTQHYLIGNTSQLKAYKLNNLNLKK